METIILILIELLIGALLSLALYWKVKDMLNREAPISIGNIISVILYVVGLTLCIAIICRLL